MCIVTISVLGSMTAGKKDQEMINSVLFISSYGNTTLGNNSKAVCRWVRLKLTQWGIFVLFFKIFTGEGE